MGVDSVFVNVDSTCSIVEQIINASWFGEVAVGLIMALLSIMIFLISHRYEKKKAFQELVFNRVMDYFALYYCIYTILGDLHDLYDKDKLTKEAFDKLQKEFTTNSDMLNRSQYIVQIMKNKAMLVLHKTSVVSFNEYLELFKRLNNSQTQDEKQGVLNELRKYWNENIQKNKNLMVDKLSSYM